MSHSAKVFLTKRFLAKLFYLLIFAAFVYFIFTYAKESTAPSSNAVVVPPVIIQNEPTAAEEPDNTPPLITPKAFFSLLAADSDELVLTDEVFCDDFVIIYKAGASTLPDTAKYTVTYKINDDFSFDYTDYTCRPRMGYISVASADSSKILDSCGNEIAIPDEYHLSFASCRDKDGNPVFVDYISNEYYILADGTVQPSDYDSSKDFRGLIFDYPSYYGVAKDTSCTVISSERGFGYSNGTRRIVAPIYRHAYAFSEGLGCAYDALDRLFVFNENGAVRAGGLNNLYYGCGESSSDEGLGYYYYDEGLTRANRRTNREGVITKREVLIDTSGNELKTPADFEIIAYSNGRILLEKEGVFGYMTSRGKWLDVPSYTFARPFFEGLAVVGAADGKKGVINRDGEYVIQPIFDEITDCSGGVICVFDNDTGWHILHKTKKATEQQSNEALTDEQQAIS